MSENEAQMKEERDKIVRGLEETYRRLVEYKKQINSPMVVIRDGKITEVDAKDMPPTVSYRRKAN